MQKPSGFSGLRLDTPRIADGAASTRSRTSNADDSVLLSFKRNGSSYHVNYNREDTVMERGQAAIHRTRGAMECGSQSPGSSLYVKLPPDVLRQIAPGFDVKNFRVVRETPAAVRLLVNYLGALHSLKAAPDDLTAVPPQIAMPRRPRWSASSAGRNGTGFRSGARWVGSTASLITGRDDLDLMRD